MVSTVAILNISAFLEASALLFLIWDHIKLTNRVADLEEQLEEEAAHGAAGRAEATDV